MTGHALAIESTLPALQRNDTEIFISILDHD